MRRNMQANNSSGGSGGSSEWGCDRERQIVRRREPPRPPKSWSQWSGGRSPRSRVPRPPPEAIVGQSGERERECVCVCVDRTWYSSS
jgi:hypothetical protein